jgi:hypothetical protein
VIFGILRFGAECCAVTQNGFEGHEDHRTPFASTRWEHQTTRLTKRMRPPNPPVPARYCSLIGLDRDPRHGHIELGMFEHGGDVIATPGLRARQISTGTVLLFEHRTRRFARIARNMPFDLPDLPWWGWAFAAIGGGLLALFVSKFSEKHRSAGTIAAVIAVLATMCGVRAMFEWIRGY